MLDSFFSLKGAKSIFLFNAYGITNVINMCYIRYMLTVFNIICSWVMAADISNTCSLY